jgi:hypothetical protein
MRADMKLISVNVGFPRIVVSNGGQYPQIIERALGRREKLLTLALDVTDERQTQAAVGSDLEP